MNIKFSTVILSDLPAFSMAQARASSQLTCPRQVVSHIQGMLAETPATRHMRRLQLVGGMFALVLFTVVPVVFLLEFAGYEGGLFAFLPLFGLAGIGVIWMSWIKCPNCEAFVTKLYHLLSPTSIHTHCPRCGRSTALPYKAQD